MFDLMRSLRPVLSVVVALSFLYTARPTAWGQTVTCDVDGAQARPGPRADDIEQLVERMKRTFQALEAVDREIARETFDPRAIVHRVGDDPARLLEWVRDNTCVVPYRGALRGPKGVLMDRLGNSLDRALLLHELLDVAGHQSRLARTTLALRTARQLLTRTRPIPNADPIGGERSRLHVHQQMDRLAATHGLDAEGLHLNIDAIALRRQRLAEDLLQAVAEQTPLLAASVEAALGHQRPSQAEQRQALKKLALDTLRDHWWVQWWDGSGWVDLDPTLPVGEAPPIATSVLELTGLDDLGADVHRLKISVYIELWEAGAIQSIRLLEHSLIPAEHIGQTILLRNFPMGWSELTDRLPNEDPIVLFKNEVLRQREWLPVLTIDGHDIFQYSFAEDGTISNPKLPGYVQAVAAGQKLIKGMEIGAQVLGERIWKIFGSKARSTDDRPKGKFVTAQWIEYELHAPGRPTRTIRREIFDLLGPATRAADGVSVPAPQLTEQHRLERGLALLGETEVMVPVCRLSPAYVEHLMNRNLLSNQEVLCGLARHAAAGRLPELAEQAAMLVPAPGELYALALLRHGSSRFSSETYLGQPNILSVHRFLRPDPAGGFVSGHGFDIVANDVAVHPGATVDPYRVRLEQGVLDTNAERLLAGASAVVNNTAQLFAVSSGLGIEWVALQGTAGLDTQNIALPADVLARIRRQLEQGSVVIAPSRAVPVMDRRLAGWWQVDPRTGRTLGIGDRGWGQVTTEAMLMLDVSLMQVKIANNYVKCIHRGIVGRAVSPEGAGALAAVCLAKAYGTAAIGYLTPGLGSSLAVKVYELLTGIHDTLSAAAEIPGH